MINRKGQSKITSFLSLQPEVIRLDTDNWILSVKQGSFYHFVFINGEYYCLRNTKPTSGKEGKIKPRKHS